MKNLDIRIGDYVETKDGRYGYIIKIGNEFGEDRILWHCVNDQHNYTLYECTSLDDYIRIGQYNFIKQNKIEKLTKQDLIMNTYYKINEIIDKLNAISDDLYKEE